MMGMVTYAWPEPDGIKKFRMLWMNSMPMADNSGPTATSGWDRPLTIVCSTCPSLSVISIALAKPKPKKPWMDKRIEDLERPQPRDDFETVADLNSIASEIYRGEGEEVKPYDWEEYGDGDDDMRRD